MPDERPAWARRIREERDARGWSQREAVLATMAHSHKRLSLPNLLRNWKRWESGEVEPDDFHKPLIAKTFGTVTAAMFPRMPSDTALMTGGGMDTLELVTRLRMSDVSPGVVDALQITADRLGTEYSRVPPEQLIGEGKEWLHRLGQLLERRLTLAQHRDVLAAAGQVALTVGCLEYDMGRAQPAEATRRAALSLGEEAGDANTVGWAWEMRAWYALTRGDYRAAIAAANAGLSAVDPRHSVAVQLLAHRAKAWARIGDRRQVEVSLDQGRTLLEALPYPDNPDNHFVVDPSKWDFYTMDAYRHVGDDKLAETHARQVLRGATDLAGVEVKPMRTAEARVTLGVVAARGGDLDSALGYGRQALAGSRQSLPSLLMVSRELANVLEERFPGESGTEEYLEELAALRAA